MVFILSMAAGSVLSAKYPSSVATGDAAEISSMFFAVKPLFADGW